jgi:hypothetical protein
MRFKQFILLVAIAFSSFLKAQDSTNASKLKHDLGFNSVLLIKQLISNSPSNVSTMLPYQVIYTMHLPNKIGVRLGLGIQNSKSQTSVSGQFAPRTTNVSNLSTRVGANYNFLQHKQFTCNAFVDGVYQNSKTRTVNTTTFTSGFGQTSTEVVTTENISSSIGGQFGFGIKYNFAKHLGLYIETPLQFTTTQAKATFEETLNGFPQSNSTIDKTTASNVQIFLPTTLFLLITF